MGRFTMCAAVRFSPWFGFEVSSLSKEELTFLEVELFMQVYKALREYFYQMNKPYLLLLKFDKQEEEAMIENNFWKYIINDILRSEEYSITGIAFYTETSEEVICDLITGVNTRPSFPLTKKVIDLHRTVRPMLYNEMVKRIIAQY